MPIGAFLAKKWSNLLSLTKMYKKALAGFRLLRTNVTGNDQESTVLEKYFSVVAPWIVLFLYPHGKEIPNSRIVGEMSASRFLKHLENLRS